MFSALAVRPVCARRISRTPRILAQSLLCMFNKSASVVRQYSLFQDKLVLKISIDEVEVLQIVVDTATLDFSTTLCDCSLDVLANETTLAVKLLSHFHDEGVSSKGE